MTVFNRFKLTPKLAPIPKIHQNFIVSPKTTCVDLPAFRSYSNLQKTPPFDWKGLWGNTCFEARNLDVQGFQLFILL